MQSKKKTLRKLRSALKKRNANQVRNVLRLYEPNLRTPECSQMLWGVVMDSPEITSMLIHAGADFTVRNPTDNSTLLLYTSSRSANEEYQNLAFLLLELDANVNFRTRSGDTALHLAARNDSVPLVKALIERELSVDIANTHGETAICAAAKTMRAEEMLRMMVEQQPVDARKRNKRLLDAIEFFICCESDEATAIEKLLGLGVDVNKRSECGLTPISLAGTRGKSNLIHLLARYGADTNELATESNLPAIRSSYLEQDLIDNLVRHQDAANIDTRDAHGGRTRLHVVCACSHFMHPRNVQLLLHLGADVNALDHRGDTPFALMPAVSPLNAARQLYVRHLALLFSKGAIVSDVDMMILQNDVEAGRFYGECLDELRRMKETAVHENFSAFDFFVKSTHTVSELAWSRDFVARYKEKKALFPLYRKDLEIAFNLAMRIRDLLMLAEGVLTFLTNRVLPMRAVEIITLYLSFESIWKVQRKYFFNLWAQANVPEVVDDRMVVN